MVTDLNANDVRADGLDDTGALVPVDDRRRMRHQPLHVVEVAVTHTAPDVADPDLVGSRLHQVEHFDFDALTGLVVHCCLNLHRAWRFIMAKAERSRAGEVMLNEHYRR
jgi:hypothetical protein